MRRFRKTYFYLGKTTFYLECVAMVAYIFMMALTTVDVIGAKVFLSPIPGALDMMMIAQLVMLSLALGGSYVSRRHVEVTFFVFLLPEPVQHLIDVVIRFLVMALFALITWRMYLYGLDLQNYSEVSPTIRIPLYPFAYVAVVAFIPATLASLIKFIQSVLSAIKSLRRPRAQANPRG